MLETRLLTQRLKLQHLKLVMAVAEWGSMARAARQLAISQPVVSKTIADLEEMLGVPLFDRSTRGVDLTPYGRALLARSIAIFDDLKTSVDEIKFMADPTAGEVRIGCTEPLLAGLRAAIMQRLWRRYPGANFRIVEAESAVLLNRDLPERRIELALVPLIKAPTDERLDVTVLFKDRLSLVVGANTPWARRRRVALADLVDEPWCLAPTSIGSLITEAFRSNHLKAPRIAVTTTTSHLLFQLLESGRFVGHFGSELLRFFASRYAVKKLSIELPVDPFAVALVRIKHRSISPLAQIFIECALDVARPIANEHLRSVVKNGAAPSA